MERRFVHTADYHAKTFVIHTASARSTRHLGELTDGKRPVTHIGAFRQRGDNGGAGGHIDASGEGFGGKDGLDQIGLKQDLNKVA